MEIKTFYGNAILTENDLKETEITNKIELDYFKVEMPNETQKEDAPKLYGIEIVKKEYLDDQNFVQEKKCINSISQSESYVTELLDKVKNFKVTPVALQYVVEDFETSIKV